MIRTEVIIVGGGPAGAACALRLKQKNVDCLVLDRSPFPRSKPCAGWITPGVFDLLQIQSEDYPHSLTRFESFKISLRGFKFHLPARQYAIRRIEFDAWLLHLADVTLIQHQAETIEKTSNGYRVDGQFEAKYLVGAGGTHCPVRRTCFSFEPADKSQGLILAKEEEFRYAFSDDRCHLWFFEEGLPGYSWYVPKAGGWVNVGIGASAAGLRARGKTLNEFWERYLEKLEKLGLVRGHPYSPSGYSYYLRSKALTPSSGKAILVGDSLRLATKDMGEGIRAAIQSGLLAAESITSGKTYSLASIPRYSFPSLLGLRK